MKEAAELTVAKYFQTGDIFRTFLYSSFYNSNTKYINKDIIFEEATCWGPIQVITISATNFTIKKRSSRKKKYLYTNWAGNFTKESLCVSFTWRMLTNILINKKKKKYRRLNWHYSLNFNRLFGVVCNTKKFFFLKKIKKKNVITIRVRCGKRTQTGKSRICHNQPFGEWWTKSNDSTTK